MRLVGADAAHHGGQMDHQVRARCLVQADDSFLFPKEPRKPALVTTTRLSDQKLIT